MSIDPAVYTAGIDHLLETGVTAHTSSLAIILLAPAYVFSAGHSDIADLGANAIGTSDTLTGVSVASGWVLADDPLWTGGTTPSLAVAGYVIYDATHDFLLGYSGRVQDGRPIDTTTGTEGITMTLADGRLLRVGGAPS